MNITTKVCLAVLCFFLLAAGQLYAQTSEGASPASRTETPFAPQNSWGIFGEYAPNSSHIFLGVSQQRRLLMFGGEYSRRLHAGKFVTINYLVEARPLMLESDPVQVGFRNIFTGKLEFPIKPQQVTIIDHTRFMIGPGDVVIPAYSRQTTYAGGLNPLGLKMNFLPHHRLQPVVTTGAGFVISRRDIPVQHASSFNFRFELGAGLEWFFQPRRSFRLDYRVGHISNAYTGTLNPGIDFGLFQLTYSFGK